VSILKPEASVMAGIATVAGVYGIYQLNLGNVSSVAVSDANHPALETTRKKAGWTAIVFVSALTLITKDGNVGVLGYGTIIAMEVSYRHAVMTNPDTNAMEAPSPSSYSPAENVVPMYQQGEAG
jgi:hypothetical protein